MAEMRLKGLDLYRDEVEGVRSIPDGCDEVEGVLGMDELEDEHNETNTETASCTFFFSSSLNIIPCAKTTPIIGSGQIQHWTRPWIL